MCSDFLTGSDPIRRKETKREREILFVIIHFLASMFVFSVVADFFLVMDAKRKRNRERERERERDRERERNESMYVDVYLLPS